MKTHYKLGMKTFVSLMAILAFMALSNWAHALNPAQCRAFASGGKVSICHATGGNVSVCSTNNPFVNLRVGLSGCLHGHAGHQNDYVAVNDPTCSGGSCLPQDAPCDASLPCCEGSSCTDGTCKAVCEPPSDLDLQAVCAAAVLKPGPCNVCCFNNPACGSSGGPPGNECGNAGGMGCTNQDQNQACLAAIVAVGCGDECNVCAP